MEGLDEFLEEFADVLEAEVDELNDGYDLDEEVWDSLAVVSTLALIDEYFEVVVDAKKLEQCKTVGQVIGLVKANVDG